MRQVQVRIENDMNNMDASEFTSMSESEQSRFQKLRELKSQKILEETISSNSTNNSSHEISHEQNKSSLCLKIKLCNTSSLTHSNQGTRISNAELICWNKEVRE